MPPQAYVSESSLVACSWSANTLEHNTNPCFVFLRMTLRQKNEATNHFGQDEKETDDYDEKETDDYNSSILTSRPNSLRIIITTR